MKANRFRKNRVRLPHLRRKRRPARTPRWFALSCAPRPVSPAEKTRRRPSTFASVDFLQEAQLVAPLLFLALITSYFVPPKVVEYRHGKQIHRAAARRLPL